MYLRAKRLSNCEQLTKRLYRAVETLQSREIVDLSLKIKNHLCRLFIKQMRNGGENLSLREYSCSQPKRWLWYFEEALGQGTRTSLNKAKMVSSGPYFSLLFELPTVYLLLLLVFSVWHGFFHRLSWVPFFEVFFFWKKKTFCWLWFLMCPPSPPPLLGECGLESILSLTPATDWMGGHWSWDVETWGRCSTHLISSEAWLDASQERSFTCRASSALLCWDNSTRFGSIATSPVYQRSSSLSIVQSLSAEFISINVIHHCQYSAGHLYQHKSSQVYQY